jgi:hypothetical protein
MAVRVIMIVWMRVGIVRRLSTDAASNDGERKGEENNPGGRANHGLGGGCMGAEW